MNEDERRPEMEKQIDVYLPQRYIILFRIEICFAVINLGWQPSDVITGFHSPMNVYPKLFAQVQGYWCT